MHKLVLKDFHYINQGDGKANVLSIYYLLPT